jgi:hypothetical protein
MFDEFNYSRIFLRECCVFATFELRVMTDDGRRTRIQKTACSRLCGGRIDCQTKKGSTGYPAHATAPYPSAVRCLSFAAAPRKLTD